MYIKVSKTLSTKYYQENKERLVKDKQKLVKDIIFFNEKKKKWQYGCERYKNLPEDEKQKLVEYTRSYYRMRKKCLIIIVRNYHSKR